MTTFVASFINCEDPSEATLSDVAGRKFHTGMGMGYWTLPELV